MQTTVTSSQYKDVTVRELAAATFRECVLLENDPAFTLLEQALLKALTLAQQQGDVDAARSLAATLEKLRSRKPHGPAGAS